jgi:ArsR family transcriptional regulator
MNRPAGAMAAEADLQICVARSLDISIIRKVSYVPMKSNQVIAALGALAHEHRLAVYRLLVARGPEGLPAGSIADRIGLAPSSLTFHLQSLQRAGLITRRREGRQLIYSTDFGVMNAVVMYLTENCCGSSAACVPCVPPGAVKTRKTRTAA